jgi:stearoyl-CoA desaturase (delta-9 desaturase)
MGGGEVHLALAPGIVTGGRMVLAKRVENALLIGIPAVGSSAAIYVLVTEGWTLVDVSSFVIFYVAVGIGVALGMHRYFTHRSFEAVLPLRVVLAAVATMSFQGTILRWVVDHRRHHAHADREGDVHSPYVDPWGRERDGLAGLAYAHIGWMFDGTATDPNVFGADLQRDRLVMFFTRTHWFWLGLSLLLPYLYGLSLGGFEAAWTSMLVGGCVRTSVLHNVVWAVNSIGHSHGNEDFAQSNHSKNNIVLALLTFGDGWHNNHHRFPRSAFHGLGPREIDVNGMIITILERIGLVRDVVRIAPDRIHAARRK